MRNSFIRVGPKVWNSVPLDMRNLPKSTLGYFRKNPHPPDGWNAGNSRGRGGGSKALEIMAGGGIWR